MKDLAREGVSTIHVLLIDLWIPGLCPRVLSLSLSLVLVPLVTCVLDLFRALAVAPHAGTPAHCHKIPLDS